MIIHLLVFTWLRTNHGPSGIVCSRIIASKHEIQDNPSQWSIHEPAEPSECLSIWMQCIQRLVKSIALRNFELSTEDGQA